MKLHTLDKAPWTPVSHDPALKKKVLAGPEEGISCIRHISHIVLNPGDEVSGHLHEGAFEVFYCIRGAAPFSVNTSAVELKKGGLLIVEPGETHSIAKCPEECELLYFLASVKQP